ncbi:MAG: DUF4845 domain-containing protein [Azoarcus sp.]|nr:DUF4845 domain-containing protein [Azoarcus sp.]PKO56204.1 MAG: DUF4845 domain-containing protein [Betaproteobacteria bacterium HGW-Betaproteobacteria-21]
MIQSRQRGLSLISVLIVGAFLAFVLLVAFRTVPAINEYMSVQRIVKIIADEGDGGAPVSELRRSFDRRGQIDDVSTITGADLMISKQAGKVVVEAEYSRKVPVAGNVSLLLDFQVSSAKP